jgi:Protein of unknown function (DUF3455)
MPLQSGNTGGHTSPAEPTAEAFTASGLADRSHGLSIRNKDLPSVIQVDEQENKEVARRIGRGYQVYDCLPPAPGTWQFREPLADLFDGQSGARRGIHFVGPYWADADGSRVGAAVVTEADSPDDPGKDVPWLLLEAGQWFGHNGVFSNITFIQRVLTADGAAPPSCDATGGAALSVPYTALYIFWAGQ